MESKINVAVTGYFGTGSSAVVDLLKEYENVRVVPFENQSYEHNVLYHHGGLYDVCTLLSRSQKKGRIKPQITLLKHDFHY